MLNSRSLLVIYFYCNIFNDFTDAFSLLFSSFFGGSLTYCTFSNFLRWMIDVFAHLLPCNKLLQNLVVWKKSIVISYWSVSSQGLAGLFCATTDSIWGRSHLKACLGRSLKISSWLTCLMTHFWDGRGSWGWLNIILSPNCLFIVDSLGLLTAWWSQDSWTFYIVAGLPQSEQAKRDRW